MTPATQMVLRKLLEGMQKMCESALALLDQEAEPEAPVPNQRPRYLGDTDNAQG